MKVLELAKGMQNIEIVRGYVAFMVIEINIKLTENKIKPFYFLIIL